MLLVEVYENICIPADNFKAFTRTTFKHTLQYMWSSIHYYTYNHWHVLHYYTIQLRYNRHNYILLSYIRTIIT